MSEEGLKYDQGKLQLDLIPRAALDQIAKVLGFGKEKYAAHNWRKGIVYSRLIAAALRHITAYNDGEDLDPESGLSHVAHALCCLSFLSTFIAEKRTELDDRYKKGEKVQCEEKESFENPWASHWTHEGKLYLKYTQKMFDLLNSSKKEPSRSSRSVNSDRLDSVPSCSTNTAGCDGCPKKKKGKKRNARK